MVRQSIAKLYSIDPIFTESQETSEISNEDLSNLYSKEFL